MPDLHLPDGVRLHYEVWGPESGPRLLCLTLVALGGLMLCDQVFYYARVPGAHLTDEAYFTVQDQAAGLVACVGLCGWIRLRTWQLEKQYNNGDGGDDSKKDAKKSKK